MSAPSVPGDTATVAQCPSCGTRFTCDPGGACWCAALPPVAPRPDDASGCFCPQCLSQRAGMGRASAESKP